MFLTLFRGHAWCYAGGAMTSCSFILTIVFLPTSILCGHFNTSQSPTQGTPTVEVIKFSWSKERLNWERDPFAGPVENFDEMRARARNEKRLDDAKRGGGGSGADRIKRESKADEANLKQQREKGPPRYVFVYKTKIKNNAPTAITAIDWDYVFHDRVTGEELGRRQFASTETVGSGKSRELTFTVSAPPTQRISVYSLDKNERAGLVEEVIIVRVEYSDGTEWVRP
jgi:hypothetical protein